MKRPAIILSLFPGAGMLDSGFEAQGDIVLRGPDKILGGDIRTFHMVPGIVQGVIGGSPCQDFSRIRRAPPTGEGVELLGHFARVVTEAAPVWWLLENVPGVPNVHIPGYYVQRMNVRASEFGSTQSRLRCFQFGSRDGSSLILRRPVTKPKATERAALATEGTKGRHARTWAEFCAVQGWQTPPHLPQLTKAARYQVVGNGVDKRVARAVATAIRHRFVTKGKPCACGCGRPVERPTACRRGFAWRQGGVGPRSFLFRH